MLDKVEVEGVGAGRRVFEYMTGKNVMDCFQCHFFNIYSRL